MTNDKLPKDGAGDDETLGSSATGSQDFEDTTAVEDGPAGEALAADVDTDADYVVVDEEAEELVEADQTVDDTPDKGDPEDMVIDDEEQLAAAETVAAQAKSSRPARRNVTTAPVKKDKPTPRQSAKSRAVAKKRTTPAAFVNQSAAELKKVIWPSGDQLREYFLVVLLFVLIVITFVSLLDLGFGRLLLWALT